MSKTFSKISTKHFGVSFFSTFFVLSRFRVFLSDGSSKTLPTKFYKKKIVSKSFSAKNPKPTFSRICFYHVFGRFSMRGVPKHDKKNIEKNKSHPSPFSYSDPPTHHGGPRLFFLPAPCFAVFARPSACGAAASAAETALTGMLELQPGKPGYLS
jgi:hypothetical protein